MSVGPELVVDTVTGGGLVTVTGVRVGVLVVGVVTGVVIFSVMF